jgi:hypothetical protein
MGDVVGEAVAVGLEALVLPGVPPEVLQADNWETTPKIAAADSNFEVIEFEVIGIAQVG